MVFQRNTKRQAFNERRTDSRNVGFDVKTNFPVYHGVVSCITLLRNAIENQNENNSNFSTFVENFIKAPKPNRLAYGKLVNAG